MMAPLTYPRCYMCYDCLSSSPELHTVPVPFLCWPTFTATSSMFLADGIMLSSALTTCGWMLSRDKHFACLFEVRCCCIGQRQERLSVTTNDLFLPLLLAPTPPGWIRVACIHLETTLMNPRFCVISIPHEHRGYYDVVLAVRIYRSALVADDSQEAHTLWQHFRFDKIFELLTLSHYPCAELPGDRRDRGRTATCDECACFIIWYMSRCLRLQMRVSVYVDI